MTNTTQTSELEDALLRLNREELGRIYAMIGGLIDAMEDSDAQTVGEVLPATTDAKKRRIAVGHIEYKMIKKTNGKTYGPYAYLRYWQGKTLKSKYIGKAQKAGAA